MTWFCVRSRGRVVNRNLIFLTIASGYLFVLAGCSAGHTAVANSDSIQLQKILDQPNHGNENLELLTREAVVGNCVECVHELLQAGAKPVYLVPAAVDGYENVARLLVEHGADASAAMSYIERNQQVYSHAQIESARNLFNRITRSNVQNPSVTALVTGTAPAINAKLTPDFHEPEHPSDYALIIGVEKYDALPSATYADGDAATAAEFVRALGVPARNVVMLTGSHATRSGIVKQLENWLTKNADETSTVFFYFSGHGAPDPATGQAYLVPFDGDPQYLAETAYPLKRLYEKLGALKSKRTIVMIDSCFSGAGGRSVLAKGSRPLVNNVDMGVSSTNGKIAVLTASGANQISGTNDEKGHGLFTYYLFNGLNGAAKDSSGQVTLQSLYDYLKPKVMDDARRANGDQTPELKSDADAAGTVLRGK